MARIRTVKPEFFRHEGLQDLEAVNQGSCPMLVFAGLWGHCDKAGRFEWRPRQLKLDILPFLAFDMAATLALLESAGFVKRYSADGKDYGEIPSFAEHQRISGKEATEPEKHPGNTNEAPVKQQGSTRDHPVGQEGKGREGKGRERPGVSRRRSLPEGFTISPRVQAWAEEKGFAPYLPAYFEKFMGYVKAKQPRYADWDEGLMGCIRDDWGDIRKKGGAAVTPISTRPSITCHTCKKRVFMWTDGKCNPCWKKSQGIAA